MNEETTPKYVVMEDTDKQITEAENHKFFVAMRSSLESPEAARSASGHDQSTHPHQDSHFVTPLVTEKSKNKKIYWTVGLAIIGAVVVLAVVLGVVLGLRSRSEASSSTSKPNNTSDDTGTLTSPLPKSLNLTSLATSIGSDTNNLLLYYQSLNGSIIEAIYHANSLRSLDSGNLTANWSIVPVTADTPTALATTAWTDVSYPNYEKRLLIFTKDGYVIQSNRTSTSSWTPQFIISNATLVSRALTVCADPMYMQGTRVYYGSAEGYVREIIYETNINNWKVGWSFSGSDPYAGIACTVQNSDSSSYVNLYLRRRATSALVQRWWSFPESPTIDGSNTDVWPLNSSPYVLPTHANVSAVFDGTNADTVMMAMPNGTVGYAKAVPHGSGWLRTEATSVSGLKAPSIIGANQVEGAGLILAVWQIQEGGPLWVFQDNDMRLRAVNMDGTVNVVLV